MTTLLKNGTLINVFTGCLEKTNVLIEDDKLKKLEENVVVGFWEKPDDSHTVIRFATSWATRKEDIIELEKYL